MICYFFGYSFCYIQANVKIYRKTTKSCRGFLSSSETVIEKLTINKIQMFYFYHYTPLSFQKIFLRQSDAMKVWFRFVFSKCISNCIRTQWSRIGKCCPCSRSPRSSHFCASEHFCSSRAMASCLLSASSNLFHSLFSIKWTNKVTDHAMCTTGLRMLLSE